MPTEDDEDDDLVELLVVLQLLLMCTAALCAIPNRRNASLIDQRLAWNDYCSRHQQRGTLKRRLRMEKHSFDKLVMLVEDQLSVDHRAAAKRGGVIIPEICIYCTLRYLAGGSYLDIADIAGISQASLYRVVWKTITAIVQCKALRIRFPKTNEEITAAIAGFAGVSTDTAIKNCVGVVDGYLLRIRVPAKKEVGNVRSFFSGHYQCYGVNIQAVADHQSRFIHFAFAAPGVTGDRDAIKQCSLHGLVEDLPVGLCVIGDAAYQPTEHMVPVYHGADKLHAKYDNFNFFASQLRIRVEMAFGIMQSKWGILQRPVGCTLRNMLWMAQAIARLHNFCINERLGDEEGSSLAFDALDASHSYIPSVPHDDNGDPVAAGAQGNAFVGVSDGHSFLREWMANRVLERQLQRPNNRKRNRPGDEEAVEAEATGNVI
jgi:DDE superfamily endonuclease